MSLEGTIAQHRTVALVAGGGLLIIAGIAAFDWLANRGKAQATSSAATGSTAGNGTAGETTSPYNNSVTDINTFTDNSVTSNNYNPPARPPTPTAPSGYLHGTPVLGNGGQPIAPLPSGHLNGTPILGNGGQPIATSSAGTLHPTSTAPRVYTVAPGDSLWSIAQHQYGLGADWTRIYDANRGTVGANPNLIFPGERLTIPSLS